MRDKPRILLDCDGPLTQGFVAKACSIIRDELGIEAQPDRVDQWDMMASLGLTPDQSARIYRLLESPGVAFDFEPNPGAVEFMRRLQRWASVYVVTSPLGGPHWAHDRERWLYEHFGLKSKYVASVKDKFIVAGDAIVDDKLSHLVEWKKEHSGLAVLWRIPPNRNDEWWPEAATYDKLEGLLDGWFHYRSSK